MSSAFDAVVVAGGAGRRLGGDKATLRRGPSTLLDHVLDACAGAGRLVVVGPVRPTSKRVLWCHEDPPGGGPLAGVGAGLARTDAELLLVLAVDLPAVGAAVPALLAAAGDAPGGATLVDRTGRRQPLAAVYRRRRLSERLAALGPLHGRPARLLLEDPDLVDVPDRWSAADDVDTPADAAALGWALPEG
jgi:molybdopterin-guanine dinucleotide biosynthesis protein A